MTREQAKREIDSLDFYLQNHTDDYGEESHTAMMMAIKALEQHTCEDAISRQAVLDAISNERWDYAALYEHAKQLPPVTPEPKTGHWIDVFGGCECSECGCLEAGYSDYCPNCGTKMVEPQESEV